MKTIFSWVLVGSFLISNSTTSAQTNQAFLPPAPEGKKWMLAWHDEFDGEKLDETKWNRLGDWKRRDGFWVKEAADVDGKEVWRSKAGGVSQVPEFLKLTNEIGNWAGDIKKAKLPDYFEVDYMRVYDAVE